jgi:transcriptional regulator GlxA family with amidase domain
MPTIFQVEIQSSPDNLAGPAHAVIDVLKMIQTLMVMRDSQSRKKSARHPELQWQSWTGKNSRQVPDLFVMPGWLAQNGPHLDELIKNNAALRKRLLQVHGNGGLIIAIGNASPALGDAGLIAGGEAVCPWAFIPTFRRLSPDVTLRADLMWTQHQRTWTCNSPVLATELVLDALKSTPLAELATATSHVLLPNLDRQQTVQQMMSEVNVKVQAAGSVDLARRYIDAHLTEPYDIEKLSRAATTSARTLLRHFEATHGVSPVNYMHQQRVTRAKVLLETTYLSIEQIAQACGYADTGSFRRIFQKITGGLPALYREQYRLRTSRRRWRQGALSTTKP